MVDKACGYGCKRSIQQNGLTVGQPVALTVLSGGARRVLKCGHTTGGERSELVGDDT